MSQIACGGDRAPSGDPDGAPLATPDADVRRATGFVANRAGGVYLAEGAGWGDPGFPSYAAVLTDRVAEPTASLVAASGDCEVWTHAAPALCDPPCNGSSCGADRQCHPYPASASAGPITVSGLRAELRFEPSGYGYLPDPDDPPEDVFDEGAEIMAAAPGDQAPAFTLSAVGVPPLVADLDLDDGVTLVIEDGVDEPIRWTPEHRGRIQLALQVGHHGQPYEGLLVCEGEDDGDLVVPGDLIAAFPRKQNGLEQHLSYLVRFDRDVVDSAAGPIELVVSSRVPILQLEHR